MAMRRVVLALLLLGGAAGCSTKPSEESCEKAVNNIRKLTGQSHTDIGADKRAAIRSCRAQSSKDTVECMAEARTSDELFACGGKMAEGVKKLLEEQKKEAADRKVKEATPAPAPETAPPPAAPPETAPSPAPEEPAKGP
jgi:hypothetical protein